MESAQTNSPPAWRPTKDWSGVVVMVGDHHQQDAQKNTKQRPRWTWPSATWPLPGKTMARASTRQGLSRLVSCWLQGHAGARACRASFSRRSSAKRDLRTRSRRHLRNRKAHLPIEYMRAAVALGDLSHDAAAARRDDSLLERRIGKQRAEQAAGRLQRRLASPCRRASASGSPRRRSASACRAGSSTRE